MSFLERLTSLFAPDDCLLCGREGSLLCAQCATALCPPPGICFGCGCQINGVGCPACLQDSGLSSLAAAARYTGVARALVAQLKFNGNQSAAGIMTRAMSAYVPEDCVIVHMPATAPHIRQRGYDQAQLMVKRLQPPRMAQRASVLARTGDKHQLGARRDERLQQLQSSLRVTKPELVRGRRVLVVDDVLTTGSSLRAAAASLLAAGASRVDGLVFAQAVD